MTGYDTPKPESGLIHKNNRNIAILGFYKKAALLLAFVLRKTPVTVVSQKPGHRNFQPIIYFDSNTSIPDSDHIVSPVSMKKATSRFF
jgi:hypothetical protein